LQVIVPKAYGQDLLLFGHKKGSGESVWSIKGKDWLVCAKYGPAF
jgi:hypothetical protein